MAIIRRARGDEAGTLAMLGAKTFTETFGHLYRCEDLQAFLEKNHSPAVYEELLGDEAFALWLAEKEGAPVGYGLAGPCSLPVPDMPESAGEFARLYLTAAAQGTGLGAELSAIMLGWLAARFDSVYLSVYAENFRAQRLYQKLGFVKIYDYFFEVGAHRDPEWIMEWRPAR